MSLHLESTQIVALLLYNPEYLSPSSNYYIECFWGNPLKSNFLQLIDYERLYATPYNENDKETEGMP